MEKQRTYIAIDLKSFYASVECVERGLDPLDTNLVVADQSRTEKTICLAVSPSLKAYGIPGRARLFEVIEAVKRVNSIRRMNAPGKKFTGKSCFASELAAHPEYELEFIVADPRMSYYMEYSTKIVNIYLKYVAAEDMHVYSVDEVFMDVTDYLNTYQMTARELTIKMIHDVLDSTGITATAGIGTNMYLCKIAMDVEAKHVPADKDGVRIAELDEMAYRQKLWNHKPLTDFWRVGKGTARKLEQRGMMTMGDVARCSLGRPEDFHNEELLYKLFGVGAELLIDHAWGWEPCTIKDIKEYKPENRSLSVGQVLSRGYKFDEALIVAKEMADDLALGLMYKKGVSETLVLTVCYDIKSLENYNGEIKEDFYGRMAPKNAHGTISLGRMTNLSSIIVEATEKLFRQIVNPELLVRRMYVVLANVIGESTEQAKEQQLSIFDMPLQGESKDDAIPAVLSDEELEKERKVQEAIINIKTRYGKNAILKGLDFEEGATARERHGQIGGHKA